MFTKKVSNVVCDKFLDIFYKYGKYYNLFDADADLLKLDILGHDDPTVLRMLQELAHKHLPDGENFDVTEIDLGDKELI